MSQEEKERLQSAEERPETRPQLLLRRSLQLSAHPLVRRGIAIVLTLFVAATMGALLYANRDTLRTLEWRIRPIPLLLSFLAYGLALTLAILAWGRMMSALGATISWRDHIRVYCVTNLARRLPGLLWYVVGRVALYDQDKASPAIVSFASALELVLIAIAALAIGVTAGPGMVSEHIHPLWVAAGVALCLAGIHPRDLRIPLRWLRPQNDNERETLLRYRQVLGWLLLYGASWLAGGIMLFAMIQAVYPIPLDRLPQTIAAWCLSGLLSVVVALLPVGFGLRELTLGLLLASFLPSGLAIVIALMTRLLLTLYDLVLALIAQVATKDYRSITPKW